MKPSLLILVFVVLAGGAFSAEPSPMESAARAEAGRCERGDDWQGAGYHWEQAMQAAEHAGDNDRAISHGMSALAAWRRVPSKEGRKRQAFALGVMAKLEIWQGRLSVARERNVESLSIIAARIREDSGWVPVAGQAPPASAPEDLLEAWARAQNDTANWLDAQGRTVDAVELLTATERSMSAAAPGGRATGFYHRKLISNRALMLNFLGYKDRAISDLKALVASHVPGSSEAELPQPLNLLYFSSQYYGPKPEYLDAMRTLYKQSPLRHDRDVRRVIAKMAFAYGETGANIADLTDVIAEARAAGAQLEAIYAQRDLAVISARIGRREGVEKTLLDSLAGLRQRGMKRGEPTLYREYGCFLAAEGRHAEALRMLNEAVRMTRGFGWMQHLPQLLVDVAEAQAKLGDRAGIARALAELDTLLANGVLIPAREFLAHCARARILLLLGRSADAEAAIANATAAADRVGLNEYQRFALTWTKDVKPAVEPAVAATAPRSVSLNTGSVDLQPVAVIATAAPGETALARFRLFNATSGTVAGTFTIDGVGIDAHMNNATGVIVVTAGNPDNPKSASVPVEISSGREILISIEARASAKPAGIRIRWSGAGATLQASCFIRQESTDDSNTPGVIVGNTSVAFDNPFYSVPLHHAVRTDGATRSFRVQPSRPCRVEILDARTGALLAVDADGDGAFRSRGDSLSRDADADGSPDLPTDTATGLGEIEVLLFPLTRNAPAARDTRVVIQAKKGAGWRSIAQDTLKSKRRVR